jgi:gamma-tubulin complex component 2
VLPLGTYFTALSAFLAARSDLSYGLVNHALCAAMRGMLAVRPLLRMRPAY